MTKITDKNGAEFDSAIHKVKKNGEPLVMRGKLIVDKEKAADDLLAGKPAPMDVEIQLDVKPEEPKRPIDTAEYFMGSENKTTEQIAEEVSRAQVPARERLKERDDMDLSGLRDDPTYRVTEAEQKPVGFQYDYDVSRFEDILRDLVAKRLGQATAGILKINVNWDEMYFEFTGALGSTDCGTLKQPINNIVSCATKVLTIRASHTEQLRL